MRALICSATDLETELSGTLLFRDDMERHFAPRLEEAQMLALAARPDVVIVDRDLPRAEKLVSSLRQDPATRRLSVVIVARGDFDPGEVNLLEAGANAILRLPAGPDWDARLIRLVGVPARKDARFPVQFHVTGRWGIETVPALAINLSLHGMLVETHVEITIGDEIGLLFRLPGGQVSVLGTGRIVRQAGPTQMGLEFTRLEAPGRGALESFLSDAPGGL
jgi:CheY-like chemotaxis protein